jgi:hypothetical protein
MLSRRENGPVVPVFQAIQEEIVHLQGTVFWIYINKGCSFYRDGIGKTVDVFRSEIISRIKKRSVCRCGSGSGYGSCLTAQNRFIFTL